MYVPRKSKRVSLEVEPEIDARNEDDFRSLLCADVENICDRQHHKLVRYLESCLTRQERMIQQYLRTNSFDTSDTNSPISPMADLKRQATVSWNVESITPLDKRKNFAFQRFRAESTDTYETCDTTTSTNTEGGFNQHGLRVPAARVSAKIANSYFRREEKKKAQSRKLAEKEILIRSGTSQHVESERHSRFCCFPDIVGNKVFESFACLLIISDAIIMGVEVELSTHEENDLDVFLYIRAAYAAMFTVELLLRLCQKRCAYFTEDGGWNNFDAAVTTVGLVEVILEETTRSSLFASQVRTVRIVRIVRIFRMFRILRFFRSLRVLMYSIVCTMQSLAWTMFLLLVIMYLFAIVFTSAATSNREIEDLQFWFGDVVTSILTLFKSATGGVSWQEVVVPLESAMWLWVALFIVYIAFVQLTVMNVVTSVFCQNAIEGAQIDKDLMVATVQSSKEESVKQLREIFENMVLDKDGLLTLVDLERAIEDDQVQAFFTTLDLTVSEAWDLFKLLDADESGGVSIEEFVNGCLRLKGTARAMDIAMMIYENRWVISKLDPLIKEAKRKGRQRLRHTSSFEDRPDMGPDVGILDDILSVHSETELDHVNEGSSVRVCCDDALELDELHQRRSMRFQAFLSSGCHV